MSGGVIRRSGTGPRQAGSAIAAVFLLVTSLAFVLPTGWASADDLDQPAIIKRPSHANHQAAGAETDDQRQKSIKEAKAKQHKPFPVLTTAKLALVAFNSSPFPYRGVIPGKNVPFLDAVGDDGRRGHTSGRGGIYFEDTTYSDRRALIAFPKGFDPNRPSAIVVYFHGNGATLARDVAARQQIPDQLDQSGLNAILVAPQFAFDALDSSAGTFWTQGGFKRFLDEAATRMADVYGDREARSLFGRLPVILVAYSGGYNPAAFALSVGGANKRLIGLLLMDALYGEEDRFADWIAAGRKRVFFFSAFTKAAEPSNQNIEQQLAARRIHVGNDIPARLSAGTIVFYAADPLTVHDDFVTKAWTDFPLRQLLSRISGFAR